jgi:molybdopterin-guanine dinucleotide biosynthesis protein A
VIPSIEARNPTPGDWTVACDSYGKVRHSRKACIYTVVNRGQAGERIVTLAARIPNWDDAFVMSAARDMRDALRDLLPVFDNSSMQTLATVYAEPIARAQSALEKAEHRT